MPISSHSHSGEFCLHADGTLKDIVEKAIGLSFTHYGLSEHMPRFKEQHLYEEEIDLNVGCSFLESQFEQYVAHGKKLQHQYKDKINIVVGIETDVIDDSYILKIMDLRACYPLDYVVGSVHHACGIPIDIDEKTFNQAVNYCGSIDAVIDSYFDCQYDLICMVRPEVIGHFDVARIFCQNYKYTASNVEKIKRNIKAICDINAMVEINTAGLYHEFPFPFPQKDVLQMMIEMGVKFTLSDDCHGPLTVGRSYNELYTYLKMMGIHEVHYLEWDHDKKAVSRKRESNICEHSFWKTSTLCLTG